MADRTTKLFYSILTSCTLALSGCGISQQSRFQTSFLPAPPEPAAEAAELVPPPKIEPNLHSSELPKLIGQETTPAGLISRADQLIQRAERHFQRGKKFYQAKDAENARKEFDAAIDLMLDASDDNPRDRQDYEKRFEAMVDAIHRYDLAGLGAAVDVERASFDRAPLEDILQMTFPVDPRLKNKVREQMAATVSQLPLSVNDSVLGYIHYFSQGRGYKTMIAGLERAGRYKPLIQRILDEEGVPQELIHLAQAESGFFPRAVSRKAAAGMWQFVAWRGMEYGLNRTAFTDDRLDPEMATRAAARHLRDLYNHFGDWYLAIAAYNCGPGVVERAVERTGYADFWELRQRRVLPGETTNYVPIILAMIIMDKNAAEYGLTGVNPEAPLEYDTVEITSPTHLALIADLTDAPVSELASMNPALLKGIAPAGYELRVRKGSAGTLTAALQLIPADRRASWRMHKVASGETLAEIGRLYGTNASSIAAANGIQPDEPVAGDRLVIPAAQRAMKASGSGKASVKRTVARRSTARSHTRTALAAHGAKAPARAKVRPAAAVSRPHKKAPITLTRTAANHHRRSPASN